jgi:histidinol-phosphate aminotransferase
VTRDLTWSGSQFLDPHEHTARILAAVDRVDVTTRDETWCEWLAADIAQFHGLPAGSVRVTAGATQAIDALLRSLPRGPVVDVVPNFHLTATLAGQEGWDYRPIAVREPGELLSALRSHLDLPDAVISLSSPRNPLGYQFDLADVAALLEQARGTVVLDEVYADFAEDSALRLLPEHQNLYVVRSFSKAWGLANLRVGFAASTALCGIPVGGPGLRLLPNSVSGVAQRAVRHLLTHPEPVRDSIRSMRRCRDRMSAELAAVPGVRVWPSAANYLCLETQLAAETEAALAVAGYRVRRLHDLRDYPAHFPPGIRISVPPPPHLDVVVESVRACHAAGLLGMAP